MSTRPPALPGRFYPADPDELTHMVSGFLGDPSEQRASAIIAPHAGFVFSGETAGVAFDRFRGSSAARVVIVGPSHFVPFNGLALSTHSRFSTPLGEVPVDEDAIEKLARFDFVTLRDDAHDREHSIETHLPFLQTVLDDFSIVPIVVGSATDDQVAKVIDECWGPDTLVSVSSDLSHFLSDAGAKATDSATARMIEDGDYESLGSGNACGFRAIRGLMKLAAHRGDEFTTLDLRNSGEVSGDRERVVGYGAFALGGRDE